MRLSTLLRNEVPKEFFREHMGSRAAKYLNEPVAAIYFTSYHSWPGREKNVNVWWLLRNGIAVGWNENPSRGWSFPIRRLATVTP